eukprot:g8953.t1
MSNPADSDREERYKHLLQPIRDLAQNWDVDIASSLEDYLEDLEDITITLDGGASKVNFAEAALLIQGSTSVYSRKVEHVYQLVQSTIDFLTQQKQQKSANAHASKSEDGHDDMGGEEEAAFLPLDDILEGKHIDIEVNARRSSASTRARNQRRSSVAPNDSSFSFSLHGGGANALVGHGEERAFGAMSGGGNLPDITRPPMFLMEQDYGNSFKMSTCAPQQQSGTLLIEGSSLQDSTSTSTSLNVNGNTNGNGNVNGGAAARACDFWRGVGREDDGGMQAPGDGDADDDGWRRDMGNDNDDDSDGGGGGFDFGGDLGGPENGFDEAEDDATGAGAGAVDGPRTPVGSVLADGRELRQRVPKEALKATADNVNQAAVDPWTTLDPHDPGTSQALPIRKGRTYKLPPQLRKRRGKKIEGAKAKEDPDVGGEGQTDFGGSWVGRDGGLISSVPLIGLVYPEFQYVLNREKQRKAAQTRLARQQARFFMGREEFLPTHESTYGTCGSMTSNTNTNAAGGAEAGAGLDGIGNGIDVDGNAFGGYGSDGYGSYGSDGGGGGGFGDFGGGDDDDDDDRDYGAYGGEGDSGRGGGGDDGDGVGPISLEDAFREKPQTYEDVCRSHIEAFMRGTEKYAHETQLSKRVGAWQEKLEPLMESQEKRQAFDIHAYGQSVLSRVASVLTPAQRARATTAVKGTEVKVADNSDRSAARSGNDVDGNCNATGDSKGDEPDLPVVDFGVVVAGKERFDVCRLFLASLQLANNGNVRLFHGDNAAEQETTPFELQLLTLQNSDNMAGCFAPTASTAVSGLENAPQKGAKNGAGSKAKAKSVDRRGGRRRVGGVVGTTETPSVIQANA